MSHQAKPLAKSLIFIGMVELSGHSTFEAENRLFSGISADILGSVVPNRGTKRGTWSCRAVEFGPTGLISSSTAENGG